MTEESLQNVFLSFSKVAISYMQSHLPDGKLQKTKITETIFSKDGFHEEEREEYGYYQGLHSLWMPELEQYEETKKYIEAVNSKVSCKIQIHELIAPLLDAIHIKLSFSLSQDFLLERLKAHLDNWMNNEKISFHYIPLINFSSYDDIKFTELISIQSIPNDLKSKFNILFRSSPNEFSLTTWDIWASEFMITSIEKRKIGQKTREGNDALLPLMTALRVHQSGNVGTKSRMVQRFEIIPAIMGPSGGPVGEYYTHRWGEKYLLTEKYSDKIIETNDLLSEILSTDKKNSIRTPLNRFHLAYTRNEIEDVIIDYSIVLESLLLSKERDELSYRMSIRAAWLLKDIHKPLETLLMIKAFYEMRSGIVHNGFTADDFLEKKSIKNKLIKICSELSKKSIKSFIDSLVKSILLTYIYNLKEYDSVQQINEMIDAEIVNWNS
jgi:hypothetical protein